MSSNKSIKNKMIKKYGPRCWIDKLCLRPKESKRYVSKCQYHKMKQLTFHHILEKSKGGKATEENGAILSAENHSWFHKQPPEVQRRLNEIFQEYKRRFTLLENDREAVTEFKQEELSYDKFISKARKSYNRAKEKRDLQRFKKEWEDR